MVNKGFLNANTAIMRQLMRTLRILEAEWRQVLWSSMGVGTKENQASTGRIWAAGFHHVTAHFHLAHVLKFMNCLFL